MDPAQTVAYILPGSGSYNLRWCYEKNASGAAGQDHGALESAVDMLGNVDDFLTVTALSTVTEDDALDLPNPSPLSSLTNGSPKPGETAVTTAWFGQSEVERDGSDSLQSGNLTHSQSSCFEAVLSGTKLISFYWKVDSQENADYLKFYVDSNASDGVDNYEEIKSVSGNVNWTRVKYISEGPNPYGLKWCYEKDASGAANSDAAWVDALEVTDPIAPDEALDISGQSFTTPTADPSGNLAWIGQAIISNGSSDALQSASIGDNQSSCFETNVAGDDVFFVDFDWKLDSEAGADYLKLYVNGVFVREISGDIDWTKVEFILGPRPVDINTGMSPDHTLKWCYEKNGSGASGEDKAWVDRMDLKNIDYANTQLYFGLSPDAYPVDFQTALGTADSIVSSGDADWFWPSVRSTDPWHF